MNILFVCLGNICRSPLAEGLFRHHVEAAGLSSSFAIDSAGTGDWHIGKPPDPRTLASALEQGLDISHQRARQFEAADLDRQDLILVMDRQNLANVTALGKGKDLPHVKLFRDFDPEPERGEVPDPYYGGEEGFRNVFHIVDRTSRALLEHLRRQRAL